MKKEFYSLCAIIGLSVLHSCSNDISESIILQKKIQLSQNEISSISYNETKDLEDKTLFDMVNIFANLQNETTTRSSNATSFKIIKESFINKEGEFYEKEQATRSTNGDDITSKICEIEFNNGSSVGRAIVSANANCPGIIAFIPQCSDERMLKQTGASELLHASKASYLYKAIKMKELVDSLRIPTLERISKELNIPIDEVSYERVKDNIVITDAEPTTRTNNTVQIGDIEMQILKNKTIYPLVRTNWGQGYPYNGWFSSINWDGLQDWVRDEEGRRNFTSVPAGCVNIAMAQMMTQTHYNKTPPIEFPIPRSQGTIATNMKFSPNWFQMTKTPKLDDPGAGGLIDAQRLILTLYLENKTTSKRDVDGTVISSEVAEENMLKTMNRYFKYQSKRAFNADMAWAALREKHIVLMLTSDHAFIISGILVTKKTISTRQLVATNDVYWHANFGWADECTGYYKLDNNANTFFAANGVQGWCYKMDYLNNIYAK